MDEEWTGVYHRNADRVYRLCYLYLKNPVEAEDAAQSVFLKLIRSKTVFNGYDHEKAWLTVTTRNHCKDMLKSWWKTRRVALDDLPEVTAWGGAEPAEDVLTRLFSLPEKYKTVLYLYYFEEYSVQEIAIMLGQKESTIQTRLFRGRKRLKLDLEVNNHA